MANTSSPLLSPVTPARADDRPPEAVRETEPERERFYALLDAELRGEGGARVVLGKPLRADPQGARRVTARALKLRGEPHLSFVHSHPTRDLTINRPLEEGLVLLCEMVGTDFAHAHLLTATEDVQLRLSKRGRWLLHRRAAHREAPQGPEAPEAAPGAAHDRAKHRMLDLGEPFLQALGVTDAPGRLVPAMARKWKQINRFVEIVDHALREAGLPHLGVAGAAPPGSPDQGPAGLGSQHRPASAEAPTLFAPEPTAPLRVLDFGAGKGYLTFALHHHLQRRLGLAVEVVGVELRADLVEQGNAVVRRLGLQGLRFEQGDVGRHPAQPVDLMIALHACDTATDHALHRGVQAQAAVIVSSPCCHKQLRPQMGCPHVLRGLLQHGIHLGQQAEMVTDSLRALLLESEGYDTQVFEFVALEHTQKNKMILAIRRPQDAATRARRRADRRAAAAELKAFYGVREQCLESLLDGDAPRSEACPA